MTEETRVAWACPKDGATMVQRGRRSGAWRCPQCRGVFIDVDAMRRRRDGRPPVWAPFVMSLMMSVVTTIVMRRLRRRRTQA